MPYALSKGRDTYFDHAQRLASRPALCPLATSGQGWPLSRRSGRSLAEEPDSRWSWDRCWHFTATLGGGRQVSQCAMSPPRPIRGRSARASSGMGKGPCQACALTAPRPVPFPHSAARKVQEKSCLFLGRHPRMAPPASKRQKTVANAPTSPQPVAGFDFRRPVKREPSEPEDVPQGTVSLKPLQTQLLGQETWPSGVWILSPWGCKL